MTTTATRLVGALALMLAVAVGVAEAQSAAADFRGRVFDAEAATGIENLQVKLTPPRQANSPARVARTNRDGEFLFREIPRGRYLLEVSQDVTILYRAEVDTTSTSRLEVPLRRR